MEKPPQRRFGFTCPGLGFDSNYQTGGFGNNLLERSWCSATERFGEGGCICCHASPTGCRQSANLAKRIIGAGPGNGETLFTLVTNWKNPFVRADPVGK